MTDENTTGLHRDWKSAQGTSQTLEAGLNAVIRFLARRAAHSDFEELLKMMARRKTENSQGETLQ